MFQVRWKDVFRDVAVIWVMTFLGGYIFAISTTYTKPPVLAIAAMNILLMVVGFTISGCLAKVDRFGHLSTVATCIWLLGLFNAVTPYFTLQRWMVSIIPIIFSASVGGACSLFISNLSKRITPQ